MRQRVLSLLLALAAALPLAGCGGTDLGVISSPDGPAQAIIGGAGEPTSIPAADSGEAQEEERAGEYEEPQRELPSIDEDGTYNSAGDVALYLYTYDHLPDNYITKSEARDLGWTGGSVEQVAPGCAIGGDRFGNREGLLPEAEDRVYYECDIDTIGQSGRGAKRVVWSDDGLIYYTEDHYESFTLLYGEELP